MISKASEGAIKRMDLVCHGLKESILCHVSLIESSNTVTPPSHLQTSEYKILKYRRSFYDILGTSVHADLEPLIRQELPKKMAEFRELCKYAFQRGGGSFPDIKALAKDIHLIIDKVFKIWRELLENATIVPSE